MHAEFAGKEVVNRKNYFFEIDGGNLSMGNSFAVTGTDAFSAALPSDLVVEPSSKITRLSDDTVVNNLTILTVADDGTVYNTVLLVNSVLTVAGNIANDGTLRINNIGSLVSGGTTEIGGSGTTEIKGSLGSSDWSGGSFVIASEQTLQVTGTVYADVVNNGTVKTNGEWIGRSADDPLKIENRGTIDGYAGYSRFTNVSIVNSETGILKTSGGLIYLNEGSSVTGGTLDGAVQFSTGDGEASIANLTFAETASAETGSVAAVKASGTITLNSTLSNKGTLYADGMVALGGSGKLYNLGNLGKSDWSDSGTFVIGSNMAVSGGGNIYSDIINNGLIDAAASSHMYFRGKSSSERTVIVNNNTIQASSILETSNVYINNAGGVLKSAGGTFELYDGTVISGGTLDGSFELSKSSGSVVKLENVTFSENSSVKTGSYASKTYLSGNIVKNCNITLSSTFAADGDAVISGSGTLTLAGGKLGSSDWSDSGTLTFSAGQNVLGYGSVYGDIVNNGRIVSQSIYGLAFTGKSVAECLTVKNSGLISGGDDARSSVSFINTALVNSGTISGGEGSCVNFGNSVTVSGGNLTGALNFNSSAGTRLSGTVFSNAAVSVKGSSLNGSFYVGDNVSITGGSISGTMTVNGSLSAASLDASGAEIVFSVSATDRNVLIRNLSEISGGNYTVLLPEEMANGSYRLASGASSFRSAITVRNASGRALGTVTRDSGLTSNDKFYYISVVDGTLSLNIRDAEEPVPVPDPDPTPTPEPEANGPELTRNLSVSLNNKSYKAKFSWGKAALEKGEKLQGYEIVLDGNALGFVKSANYSTKTPLSVGTHTFKVRAVNQAGEAGEWYEESFAVQDVTAPQGKMRINADFKTDENGVPAVDLNWDAAEDNVGVTKYVVAYGSGKNMVETETVGTSLRISNVAGKMTFQVYAYDAVGNRSKVSRKKVTVPDVVAPDAVQNLGCIQTESKYKAALTWDVAMDNGGTVKAAGYYVTYATAADFSGAVTKKTTKNSLNLSKLQANTMYYYKVTAYDKAKNVSADSPVYSFFVKDVTPPSKPSFQVRKTDENHYELSWKTPKENVGIAGYEVRYAAAPGDLNAPLQSWKTMGNSVSLTLENAGGYLVQMCAYDTSGNVSYSSVKKINVKSDMALGYSASSLLNLNFGDDGGRNLGLAAV
jgi:chitinase D